MAANVLATDLSPGLILELLTEDGTSEGFVVQPIAEGAVVPLSGVRVVDNGSVATSPTGAWSQVPAFPTVAGAVADLATGGELVVAGGTYDEDIIFPSPSNFQLVGIGGQPGSAFASTLAGNYAGADAGSNLQVKNCTCGAAWNFHLGTLSFFQSAGVGSVDAGSLSAEGTAFGDTVDAGAIVSLRGCSFAAGVTVHNAAAPASVVDCTFSAAVQFDKVRAQGCEFDGAVTGDTTGTGLQFFDSVLLGTVSVPITWDGPTEGRSLANEIDLTADFVLAADPGQGGAANVLTANATVNFAGTVGPSSVPVSRWIVPPRTAADITVRVQLTGAHGLQTGIIDCWPTGHTVTIKEDAGGTTLITVPAQAAGSGMRVVVQVDSGVTTVALSETRAL